MPTQEPRARIECFIRNPDGEPWITHIIADTVSSEDLLASQAMLKVKAALAKTKQL